MSDNILNSNVETLLIHQVFNHLRPNFNIVRIKLKDSSLEGLLYIIEVPKGCLFAISFSINSNGNLFVALEETNVKDLYLISEILSKIYPAIRNYENTIEGYFKTALIRNTR